ncbi:MAG: glutathione S-transferase C-terminal domain-containing protein [Nitrospirales bacterium]
MFALRPDISLERVERARQYLRTGRGIKLVDVKWGLGHINKHLETDWRLFVTLIRFDAVYHGHFKCNIRRIADFPNLFGYVKDLYQQEGISDTVNFDHIKRHYYMTHEDINPTRIVPLGPVQDFTTPHGRGTLK